MHTSTLQMDGRHLLTVCCETKLVCLLLHITFFPQLEITKLRGFLKSELAFCIFAKSQMRLHSRCVAASKNSHCASEALHDVQEAYLSSL